MYWAINSQVTPPERDEYGEEGQLTPGHPVDCHGSESGDGACAECRWSRITPED